MQRAKQMSESLELGIVLTLAGGFMDAYSYVCRGHVFANAQTGNMLLFAIHISQADWSGALHYLFPVLAFALGIALADLVRIKCLKLRTLHWRQLSVLFEAIILLSVALFPQSMNLAANSLTSFACGIQVESFRKICGNGVATTMCIGNLRSATQNLCDYLNTKNSISLQKGILYYGIICCFGLGAVLGNFCVAYMHEKAILICAALLLLAILMMLIDKEHAK